MLKSRSRARRDPLRKFVELAEKLERDEVVVYAPEVSDEPVYAIRTEGRYVVLTYKFKGETAWEEAKAFAKDLMIRGFTVAVDEDASERDKVFVDVILRPENVRLDVREVRYESDEFLF